MFSFLNFFNRRFKLSEKKLIEMGFQKTDESNDGIIFKFILSKMVFVVQYQEKLWYFGQEKFGGLATYMGQEITDESIKYIKAVIKTSTNRLNHVF